MGAWKELTKDFNLVITTQTISAVRSFLWDTNGTVEVTLPKLGDKLPDDLAEGEKLGLYVKKMTKTLGGGHPAIKQWVMEYNTIDPQSNETSLDDLMRTVDIGGEFLNIGKPPDTSVNAWSDNTELKQDLVKRVATITIKVPRIYGTINSIMLAVVQAAGMVNASTWNGCAAESVLFNGVSGSEFRNDKGMLRWRVEFNFEVRFPDWQTIWNPDQNKWMKLKHDLYETADFSLLLKGSVL